MADAKLAELDSKCDAVFVEVHMEATSEKIALGWHLDGRVALHMCRRLMAVFY